MGKHSSSVWKGKEKELEGIIFRLSLCNIGRLFVKENSDQFRVMSQKLDKMFSSCLLERFWLFFGKKKLVAEVLGTSPSNIYRWYRKGVPSRNDIIVKLSGLELVLASLVTFKQERARKWLLSPLICFNNERPIDLIRDGRITEVTVIIGRIAHGIMS